MKNNLRSFAAIGLIITILLGVLALLPSKKAEGNTDSATAYLASKTLTPWTIMALAAAGKSPDTSSLVTVSASKAIDLEAPILALTAAGKDPRTFGSADLVAALKGYTNGGQLGEAGMLNDDIFGILALVSAGVPASDPAVANSIAFLKAKQNADGGWGFAVGGTSDTNTTSAAIMALASTGATASDPAVVKALDYLRTSQNADGGFPYDPKSTWSTASDSASDAWVSAALNALSLDPRSWSKGSSNPLDHLLSLQDPSGFFKNDASSSEDGFSAVTTSYAVVALLGKSYPVAKLSSAVELTSVSFRIEGQTGELCSGKAAVKTGLDVVKAAAEQCGLAYTIQDTAYGPYLTKIGPDAAEGMAGWMYLVNGASLTVGAADYLVKPNDAVLWFYGYYDWKETRLSLSASKVDSGSPVTATVEAYDSGWQPLSGATVKAGAATFTTGADGKAVLTLPDGTYQVLSEKVGYVRSNAARLIAGAGGGGSLSLSANISSSTPTTTPKTVSFSVDSEGQSGINFGDLTPGTPVSRTFTARNKGQVGITVVAEVQGDSIFQDYLKIDSSGWRSYVASLEASAIKASTATLFLPQNYSGQGTKNGTLMFWATVKN